jgi:MYXO-CTERM domain-containing protein
MFLVLAVAMTGSSSRSWAATDVCYKGGPTLANFKLNGTAELSGSSIIITKDQGDRAGSAMYQTKLSSQNDFHIKMYVRISSSTSPIAADGMAFVMHNDPRGSDVVGVIGYGIGYQGIANSIVVEFDTYHNAFDPPGPHIAITKQGSADHSLPVNRGLPVVEFSSMSPPLDPTSGTPLTIWIDYAASAHLLSVYVSNDNAKPISPALNSTLDLSAELGSTFYIGFTASTGGGWDQHEFLDLFASDTGATADAGCCDTSADCARSLLGNVCDPYKHVCGACLFSDISTCTVGEAGCDQSDSHNACIIPCDGNYASGTSHPCASPSFPACRASGLGAGSCGACGGDYRTTAVSACAIGAPFCTTTGYCGLCTSNADCRSPGVAHSGAICDATTGSCGSTCLGDADCAAGATCVTGACVAAAGCHGDGECPPGSYCSGIVGGDAGSPGCAPKIPTGMPMPNDGLHDGSCAAAIAVMVCQSGLCSPAANTCAEANGAPCAQRSECVSNVCNDGKCGSPDGQSCTSADSCRTGHCSAGICGEPTVDPPAKVAGQGCACVVARGDNGAAIAAGVAMLLGFALLQRRRRV